MKLKLLLFSFLFLSIIASAQNNKGKFFVETGVKAFGGGDFLNYIGKTGFSFNEYNWETLNADGSPWQEGTFNIFSWAFAPRLGYFLNNNLKAGFDFQYFHDKSSSGNKEQNYASGLFLRYNFIDKKISPFIEVCSGFGRYKNIEQRISPGGGNYQAVEKLNLFYYSGSAGVTFKLSNNFNFNLSGRIQNTFQTEPKNKDNWSVSYVTENVNVLEIGPMLSVTYIFKSKKENQK